MMKKTLARISRPFLRRVADVYRVTIPLEALYDERLGHLPGRGVKFISTVAAAVNVNLVECRGANTTIKERSLRRVLYQPRANLR